MHALVDDRDHFLAGLVALKQLRVIFAGSIAKRLGRRAAGGLCFPSELSVRARTTFSTRPRTIHG
jgi:hypothetical protein